MKRTTFRDFPAWDINDKDSNDYCLSIGINDRFMVVISTNSHKNTLDQFGNLIHYKGIADLGGGEAPPTVIEDPAY